MIEGNILAALSALAIVVHALGVMNAVHAIMHVRSSQGALAWGIALLTFPWLAIPLYWILGRNKFFGYAEAIRSAYSQHQQNVHSIYRELLEYQVELPPPLKSLQTLAEQLSIIPFTCGNQVELLLDGQQTYIAMLKAIASAQDYILLQSYIINDDEAGSTFRQALVKQLAQGVRIFVLYDEIGSKKLTRAYLRSLRQAGIQVSAFHTTRGKGNHFQINFRNHRKILVVDGKVAFLGGLNIGDEYVGRDRKLSPWRDTHLQMQGPSVQCLQALFLRDWYWATRQGIEVSWKVQADETSNMTTLIFPTGPADSLPACNLFYVNAIAQAQHRLWIASPYFVPDEATLTALKVAAMRGVDVRIILPNRPDHLFVYFCSFSYYAELQSTGIQLYRYQEGFMHQKVILIDQAVAGVGTVNLDNRSFFLNFEAMGFVTAPAFVASVEKMLQQDLAASRLVDLKTYYQKPFWFKAIVRASRLLAPVL
jgi:cardiolipin synthase A/B